MIGADLRLGDQRDVLRGVECDALISDPPYGARTHDGHNRVLRRVPGSEERFIEFSDGANRSRIEYGSWTDSDAEDFVNSWAPRVRGWFVAMTSHDLYPAYRTALEAHGRYVFHPIPCVLRGMSVRLSGDGPSSWAVWMVVSRPKSKEFSSWGTLPGAYVGTPIGRSSGEPRIAGGKPQWLMNAVIRDYTRSGDLVCDPCAGLATTALSCAALGREFVGAEIDPETYARAQKRLAGGAQMDMWG